MELFDAIKKRASVREYTESPIEKSLIEQLVDAARRAPTARAVEPWEFIIVDDKDVLEKLTELIPNGPFIKDAASCIIVYCKETPYYLEDGVAATENILLATAALELGACWVAGDKKPYAPEISKLFSVPFEFKLISLISLGWPKSEPKQVKARSLKDVIHWKKF